MLLLILVETLIVIIGYLLILTVFYILYALFVIFNFFMTSVLVPIFYWCGRFTWWWAEIFFDEPIASDAVLVAIGSLVIAICISCSFIAGLESLDMVQQEKSKIMSVLNMENQKTSKLMSELKMEKQKTSKTMSELKMEKQKTSKTMSELKMVQQEKSKIMSELTLVKQQQLCVVCFDGQKEVVLKPCRHLGVCSMCAPELGACPICRRPVQGKEKIFDA